MNRRLLVCTDLDGTLLDHDNYEFQPAAPLLEELDRRGIPWILNTSKTLAELLPLRTALGHTHPFVIENGAAVCIPARYFAHPGAGALASNARIVAFGPSRDWIIEHLRGLSRHYRFRGFSDMSADEVQRYTGLNWQQAQRALRRQYSEPLVWQDDDAALARFERDLAAAHLEARMGGRFLHVSGRCDKGLALRWLKEAYAAYRGWHCVVLALGDGHNDVPMLQSADYPIIVRSPVNPPPRVDHHSDAPITELCGPQGWARAVGAFLHSWPACEGG